MRPGAQHCLANCGDCRNFCATSLCVFCCAPPPPFVSPQKSAVKVLKQEGSVGVYGELQERGKLGPLHLAGGQLRGGGGMPRGGQGSSSLDAEQKVTASKFLLRNVTSRATY